MPENYSFKLKQFLSENLSTNNIIKNNQIYMVFRITILLLLFLLSDSTRPLEKKYKDLLKLFIASLVNCHAYLSTRREPKHATWNRTFQYTAGNALIGSESFFLVQVQTAHKRLHPFRKKCFLNFRS